MSQLYPRNTEQEELSGVTNILTVMDSPESKVTRNWRDWVMVPLEVPSNNLSWIGGMEVSGRSWVWANLESTKQWVDLESINVVIMELGMEVEVSWTWRELGSERVDGLRQWCGAWDWLRIAVIWDCQPNTQTHKLNTQLGLLKVVWVSWKVSLFLSY